ncbi:MAG: hypothetical protein E7527_03640 [Ruminococcaceae bacterium]|nr:hypothetical protein [Oscillospiraceae bacterium]
MNKYVFDYAVYPSVVPADKESTVIIHPLGENTRFLPGVSYTVEIRGVETFCNNYAHLPVAWVNVTPNEAGDLVFSHHFAGEQRHALKLIRPQEDLDATPYREITHRSKRHENLGAVLYVYSLNDDLYGRRGYKGEVHCHTYESDGIQDVCHTVGNYRSAGYDFLAITDHYISMPSEKAKRVFDSAPVDMTLFVGEECHVPTEQIHAVHIGGEGSVNAYFRDNPEKSTAEMETIKAELSHLPEHIDKTDYAWRVWIARKSRELGGLSILAHPHWIWFDTYFMASAITQQLLKDGVYDALDITDQEADTTYALWAEMQAQGYRIPVVGCTDSHYTDADNPHRPAGNKGGYTLVFAPDRSEPSLMDAIRDGRSVAVNTSGDPKRVQGPYRYVKFARFLLDNFFPVYRRLCHGQGVVMAEYSADGAPIPESEHLLATLNQRGEAFARNFYGY